MADIVDLNILVEDFYKAAYDEESGELTDTEEVDKAFKKVLADYKRIAKTCEKEGISIENDYENFKNDFVTSPTINARIEILASIRENIVSMMEVCDRPPKDIIKRYSEDLVTRIEQGVMEDEFEIIDEP